MNRWLSQPPHALYLVRWLLCFALSSFIAYACWSIAEYFRVKSSTGLDPRPRIASQASPRQMAELVQRISGRHLFGAVMSSEAPATAPPSVHVIGILSADMPEQSWVILDVSGGQHTYHAGDVLPDGETLAEVQPDRVILTKDGNRYSALWEMPQLGINTRTPTLPLEGAGYSSEETPAEGQASQALTPVASVPATLQALHDLRQQLINKSHLPLSAMPTSKPKPSPP